MSISVVCVSHADGAGGRDVARRVADALGYRFADESILTEAARAEGVLPEAVARAESPDVGRSIEVDFGRVERTETVRELIRAAIARTADEGSVVIAAHAASHALADRDDVLRVLVTGTPAVRAVRLTEAEGCDFKTASRRVSERDEARAAYLKRFYGVKDESPVDYDVVVSTDRLGVEAAVRLVVAAASA